MFDKFKKFIGKVVSNLSENTSQAIQSELDIDINISDEMSKSIEIWSNMYKGNYEYLDENTKTLNLAASIASEIARLVTIEFDSEVLENEVLNEVYQAFLDDIRTYTEYACSQGGIVFKPLYTEQGIEIDIVKADKFFPIKQTLGKITSAVFIQELIKGNVLYTRLEYHELINTGEYHISNFAYRKNNYKYSNNNTLGEKVDLKSIDEWSFIEELVIIKNLETPLFSYFKIPMANTIDEKSNLGVSVYSRAVDLIEEADKQYSRILWEFEGTELAIDADASLFEVDLKTGNLELPEGKNRLFRLLNLGESETKIKEFSPEIRDASLFNGLNQLLRKIEFNCGLAYGTLSDIQETDKTATEIKSSKQRSYSTVKDIQKNLKSALEDLVKAIDSLLRLYSIPSKDYEMSFYFDDSLVMDKEVELLNMRNDVAANIIRPEIYLARKYGVSEEEALKMMPSYPDSVTSPHEGTEE